MSQSQNEYEPFTDADIKNLVDWKNPPHLADLKNDYREALASHSDMVARVNRWMSAYRGELKFKPMEGRSKIVPKIIRKQCEWRYAALEEPFLSTDDMFKVYPATYDDVQSAKQNQIILNKQFRTDINKISFINKLVRNAVTHGTVVAKLGWETKIGIVTEEVPVYTQTPEETLAVIQQMMQQGQMDEQTAMQLLQSGQPIQLGVEPQQVEKEVVNRPVIEIKDCRNIIIDPSCEGDIEKAQFIIDKFLVDLSTLKQDGRYSNLEKLEVRSATDSIDVDYYDDGKADPAFRFNDTPRKKMVAYEYWGFWDIDGDGIVKPIIATWINDTMIRLEENPFPDKKLPFVIIQYLPPDKDIVYGDADASLLEDNQDIIGAVTRSIIDLIGRSANAQKAVRKDLLDPVNRDKFNKGLDFEFNPVAGNVNDAFFMTKLPEVPRSALEVIQLMNNEAEALTGVKPFSQGITSEALGNSVGGIRSAMDAVSKRELGILRRIADGIKKIGRKIIAMNSVWLADEEIIRITDEDFVAIKRSDLAGNFDLVVDISTAEADNQKASELAFMLQTMGNSVPFELTKLILVKIAELRKVPDLAKAIEEYQPQPDPLAQEQMALQNEMLKAQIGNETAKGRENEVDVELKSAKTQTELARAKVASAQADKTNLDFLEQASGLTHERDLEKQDQQNRADLVKQALQNEADLRKQDSQNNADLRKQSSQNFADLVKQTRQNSADQRKQDRQNEADLRKQWHQNSVELIKQSRQNDADMRKTGLQLQRDLEKELLGLRFKERLNKQTRHDKNRR